MASTIQFSKTLSFIFDDPQWFRKLGAGFLIAMGCVDSFVSDLPRSFSGCVR
jgi:hypothetical protein